MASMKKNYAIPNNVAMENAMKQKLLLVTTFYNERERLKFTLDNILRQTTSDFVHLIVDDGSKVAGSDEIVEEYIAKSNHPVFFEKHENAGINMVHMLAFKRTIEFGCTHFMWLDCGDGLEPNAIGIVSKTINQQPETWLHLEGHYVSNRGDSRRKMSSKSYLPYLRLDNQFLPFCFSISTYGHFVIPFNVYSNINPNFQLVDGFYYDAQIIGALSLNGCKQLYLNKPLSIIEDDQHYSVTHSSTNNYRENLLKLSEFVVNDLEKRERIAAISTGINLISINRLIKGKNYVSNRKKIIELKKFYKSNGIKVTERYKWGALFVISIIYFC